MIDTLKRLLGGVPPKKAGREGESGRDSSLPVVALLLEMSTIDGCFSNEEKKALSEILQRKYGLSGERAQGLISAAEKELAESVDLWQFALRVNEECGLEEKIALIEDVWRIAYSDGKLESHEDYLAHKMALLLRVAHRQLIDAKLRVLQLIEEPDKAR
ncbi:MAG: TerB family tellurite resistance protein [Deltaproteobacteria bacterium]|nr:TerB family tellurite resistance protein [Deltaproteobacteria bacterium]